MQVAPIQRTNVSDEIADQLRRRILKGELKAGEKLPPERELALRFGTNRNTLREALRILESAGLLIIRQGASIEIADVARDGRLELLPYLAEYSEPTARLLRPLRHAMKMRQLLLSEAAAAAAESATAEGIGELKALAGAVRGISDAEAEQQGDYAVYAAMIRLTGSITFQWSYNSFSPAYRALVKRGGSLWKLPAWTNDSRDSVIEAIARRDPELARKRLYAHFEKLDAEMFRAFGKSASKAVKGA